MSEIKLEPDLVNVDGSPWATKSIKSYGPNDEVNSVKSEIISTDTFNAFIAQNDFITPSQYYGNINSANTVDSADKEGYMLVNTNGVLAGKVDNNPGWFWCEELKTWCSYMVNMYNAAVENYICLSVWNGKDGWIRIPNITIINDPTSIIYDIYGIAKFQEPILERIRNNRFNIIKMTRGYSQIMKNGLVKSNHHALQNITGIRLSKSDKYTINDFNDFQTIRWQTVPDNSNNAEDYKYKQVNCRQGITVGVPCVYRLPTDEICLCTDFIYRSDGGEPYRYVKDNESGGFKKTWDAYIDGHDEINGDKLMGSDAMEASKWINSICARFFGKGDTKTIENDWLNILIPGSDNEDYEGAGYLNMLDTSKIFEQQNINKVNNLKCGFTVNRPNITTTNVTDEDYAVKW